MEGVFVDPREPLVLAGSARRGGNTDTAARLVANVLGAQVLRVADLQVKPCLACGVCDVHPGTCVLDEGDGKDGILSLLNAIATAPAVCMVSPIYFYHLPAQLKALVDRAQAFWPMPFTNKPGQERTLGLILLAARPRGDKLFEGAISSLRIFCDVIGMTLAEPLLLRNLDAAHALRVNPDAQSLITDYAHTLRQAEWH